MKQMILGIFQAIRAIIAIVLYALSLVILGGLILVVYFFILIIPLRAWRDRGQHIMQRIPVWWMDVNNFILSMHTRNKWDIQGTGELNPKDWYLMISNHLSWIDILVIGSAFNRKLPFLKFFMKKELLWQLPVAGLSCYVLGYPLVARHSANEIKKRPELKGKDIESVKNACGKFKEFPTTFINFSEGTRFTEQKKLQQGSPYQHLLKPKTGGIAIVVDQLQDYLKGIVNVTIVYEPKHLGLWDFMTGNFRKIHIRYEILPIVPDILGNYYEDREFRAIFQQWLNQIWIKKDQLIEQIEQDSTHAKEKMDHCNA
jgi:1-acyl-sn-glycerol-3-phosphate acyltransferase